MTGVLHLDGLACGHGGRTILSDIHLEVSAGEFLCLLGPNGIGKTTLFKTVLRLLPPKAGRILINGEDVADWPARRFAAKVGYVPQAHNPPFPFSVLDVVSMGRAAHLGPFSQPSPQDMSIAEEALNSLGAGHLSQRIYTEISGGERQLVLIARALAQQPALLVMDEPTSNLDFGNQIMVLEQIRDLTARRSMAVVMTSHDPNHALAYADRAAVIGRDGTFRVGPPHQVVAEDYLRRTYGVRSKVVEMPPRWVCLPLGREEAACAAC